MKKLTAILLCIIMVVSYSCFGVFAATDDNQVTANEVLSSVLAVSLSEGSTSAYGETSLDLTLNSNPGFSVMILTLNYSGENISLKSAESNVDGVSVEFSNHSGVSTLAFYHLGSDCTVTGTLATLTFSVGAFFGDAEVTMSAEDGDICNSNAEALEAQFTSGKIVVDCSHTYVYEGRTEPSCSKEGEIRYICSVCQNVEITYIDKTEHVAKDAWETVLEPDCDTEGTSALLCQYCFHVMDSEPIAALGHNYEFSEYTVTKEPTCTVEGSRYRDCYTCGYREVTAIEPLGHDEGTWRTTYPSDCVNAGLASRYCNRCDYVLETQEKEVGEHFIGWAITKQPTCSEEGIREKLCLICGGESQGSESVAVLLHTAADEIIVSEPTCSAVGLAETHCKDCDALISSREIEKISHIKNTLTVISAPTSESTGTGEYRCKVCDEIVETVTLPITDGVIYAETTPTLAGKSTTVKVYIKDNPGFSFGIVRIKYDITSLVFDSVTAGDISADLTTGVPAAGEIAVLVSLENAQYTQDGLIFNVNFTLTENATDGSIQLYYDAQNDFSAENGDRVFFNMESNEITILQFVRGDCDGDGEVNTSDLAALKLYLAAASDAIGEGADIDKNGKIDTGDLAGLKLHLAGVAQF